MERCATISASKFQTLVKNKNKIYIERAWKKIEEKKISFTYRSRFERRLKELPEGLQPIIFAKVLNEGKNTLWECMLGTTKQTAYHYNQEVFLYDLYYEIIVIPMYVGSDEN